MSTNESDTIAPETSTEAGTTAAPGPASAAQNQNRKQPFPQGFLDEISNGWAERPDQMPPERAQARFAARPQDATLQNRLGMCYQRAGDANAARAAYRRALELRKDYPAAWNNLGTLDHARGKYKAAISAYGRAIRLDARDAVYHKNLGSAWLARGDAGKALEAWTEALRLDSAAFEADAMKVPGAGLDFARQCYLVAKVFAARGDVEHAIEYLTKAQAAGFTDFGRLERDRDFAAVLGDPRYAALR